MVNVRNLQDAIFKTNVLAGLLIGKLQKQMSNEYIYPGNSGPLSPDQTRQNIKIACLEMGEVANNSNFYKGFPVYRTLKQFKLSSVYELFGLPKTPLCKLAFSGHAEYIPNLVVIHCNSLCDEIEHMPKIIENRIFISQLYFKNWIMARNPETFEADLLNLIVRQIESLSTSKN